RRSRTFWSPNARRRASLSRGTARSGISPLHSNSMTSGSVNPVHRPRTEVDLVRADVTDQVRVVESPLARLEPSLVLVEVLRRQVRPQQRVDLLRNAVLVHRFLLSPVCLCGQSMRFAPALSTPQELRSSSTSTSVPSSVIPRAGPR